MTLQRRDWVCIALTIAALAAGAANKIRLGPPPDASAQMEAVRRAAQAATGEVPGMIVRQDALPRAAFDMLRPNVLEARSCLDLSTNQTFSVLLVHCGDIADMGAHYPPACYPGVGMKVIRETPMSLEFEGGQLHGVEYELVPHRTADRSPICIFNCMFVPNGTTTYSPDELKRAARQLNLRYFGAGQIQILVSSSMSLPDRTAVYRSGVSIYREPLRAMIGAPVTPPNLNAD